MNTSNSLTSSEQVEDKSERVGGVNQFARLQRAVVKLVFSFHGQSTQLDEHLKRLGRALKSTPKSAAAATLLEEVVDHVIAADLGHGDSAISSHSLADLVGQLQFDTGAVGEGKSLQRRLANATTRQEMDRLSRETAVFINRQLKLHDAREDTNTSADSEEPLARLLDSLKVDGDLRPAIDDLRGRVERARSHGAWLDAAEEAAASLSRALATGTRATPESIEIARQPLLEVLESVAASSAKEQEFDSARAQLNSASNQIELMVAAQCLGETLKSQRNGFERKVKELGGFLQNIARRVEEFHANLRHSGYTHDDSVKNAAQMQSTMHTHVDHIKGRVAEEEHLDHLKVFVSDELVKLEDTLGKQVKVESERHQNARDRVGETLRRLSEMESEMAQLRSDFEEQQSLSLIDPLTGVYNRLGYMEGISREYARWKRQGGTLSLAIFDLDLFKNINDQFGHATGDKVLTAVAALLRKHARGVDLICRLGGEEFVLIMVEANLEGAATAADKLRGIVAASQFRFKDAPVPVTISCGVASFRAGNTIEEVFERADHALYRAKNLGRDCCCVEED